VILQDSGFWQVDVKVILLTERYKRRFLPIIDLAKNGLEAKEGSEGGG